MIIDEVIEELTKELEVKGRAGRVTLCCALLIAIETVKYIKAGRAMKTGWDLPLFPGETEK